MERSSVGPWAKLERDEAQQVRAALPLLDHCLDVAAVFEAILRAGAWARLLAHTAGRALGEQDLARLVVLAALHDIGKTNSGFQARWDRRAPVVGHEGEVTALLFDPVLRNTPAGQALIGILRDWGALSHFVAAMAHHGRPRTDFAKRPMGGLDPWQKHCPHWKAGNGYDPAGEAARLIDQLRARWPQAWEAGAPLPKGERFVALFAGLLVLSDWIGSDVRRFPVGAPHGRARDAVRMVQAEEAIAARALAPLATPVGDFPAAFEWTPRGVQTAAAADDLGPIALIEAETGSGKTEAALWRWLELRRRGVVDGLYFALPTRTAAVQLHARVGRMLDRVWGKGGPKAVLAVPGYLRMGDVEGRLYPEWQVRWDDAGAEQAVDGRWVAEQSKQYLAARVAVGTIDQALFGALRIRHAPVRAAALARNLLVVDEVHASDAYMGGLLAALLKNHVAAGGQALLLSATLGGAARARLLGGPVPTLAEAVAQPYPALSGDAAAPRATVADGLPAKRVTIETAGLMHDPEAIAARAIAAARLGASVLVVRNSVAGAVAVAQAVEAAARDLAFKVNGVATLHHGRFARSDRKLLDDAVETAFGKARTAAGRILVGTQTLEQSLDIDADLLLTDLAPMDVLLQRIGRLHRHAGRERGAFAEPRVVVLRPAARDLTPLLGKVAERHGLGPGHGGSPYPDLCQIEATLRLLEANPVVSIPADNRRLVEHALHPEVLAGIATALGTAWQNHAAAMAARAHGDRSTAGTLSLDLSTPFRDMVFPDAADAVATRLGARDLLIDLEPALEGPFEPRVDRIAIPHWMSDGIGPKDLPVPGERNADGQFFKLGKRRFVYGRWGLERA